MGVTHQFVSTIPNDPAAVAAGQIVPSNWNADHIFAGGTTGSVLFLGGSGTILQDNAAFFWDDTNKTLTLNSGTQTARSPALSITQTWNATSVSFQAMTIGITTGTISAATHFLFDFQLNAHDVVFATYDGVSAIQFQIAGTAAGSGPRFGVSVTTADSFNRIQVGCDTSDRPFVGLGPGSSGRDVFIGRSASGVIVFGQSTPVDANAAILAKTTAGAPTTSDVPAGAWVLIRDTTNLTTKLYYNNAGTLQSVALV